MSGAKQVPWQRFRGRPTVAVAAALLAAVVLAVGLAGGDARADALGGSYSTDPTTGALLYTDTNGTYFVDPSTGYLLDSANNNYIDPNTGTVYYVDSMTGGFTTTPPNTSSTAPVYVDLSADDPSTLHTGPGYGTPCATGSCPIYSPTNASPTEVNLVGPNTTVDIYQQSSGAAILVNPVLMIIAVPNNPMNSLGQGIAVLGSANISQAKEYNPFNSTNGISVGVTFGSAGYAKFMPDGSAGFQGLMKCGSASIDVYSYLGLGSKVDNSESCTNWSAADAALNKPFNLALKTPVSNYGIYVYAVSTSIFGGNDLINFVAKVLPTGSFVVGFGTDASGKPYATPFTQSGLVGFTLPEPGTLSMLASSLAGFGFVAWRRRRRGGPQSDVADPAAESRTRL